MANPSPVLIPRFLPHASAAKDRLVRCPARVHFLYWRFVHLLDVLDLLLNLLDVKGSGATTGLAGKGRRCFQRHVSASWPTAQTTVLSGHIQELGSYYVVSVPYSFYANGARYGGRYEREFTSESEAQDRLQHLLSSPPAVRYKPGHPDKSVLDEG